MGPIFISCISCITTIDDLYRVAYQCNTWGNFCHSKLMRRMQPTHMAVIFDTPEPTFRHKLSPIYKGDRPTMPEELSQQIPYLHALIKAQGIPLYSLPGAGQMTLSVHSLNVPYSKATMYLSQPVIKTWLSSSMIM